MSDKTEQANTAENTKHVWNFFRAGGALQTDFKSGADIAELASLDQKLWMALSCPVAGQRFDSRTLALIDSDGDGRIRAPELLSAIEWLKPRLVSFDAIFDGSSSIPLNQFQSKTPEGKALAETAKEILAAAGKADAKAISLDDALAAAKVLADSPVNGDGVVPPESAEGKTADALKDIIACLGAVQDASGKDGVNQTECDVFFAEVKARLQWLSEAVAIDGVDAEKALDAVDAVRAKVDDYFRRCDLAAFDNRAENSLNGDPAALLSADDDTLATFPLAKVAPNAALPLEENINPLYASKLAALKQDAVVPLIGETKELTRAAWKQINEKLKPFSAWKASENGRKVASLSKERLEELDAPEVAKAISDRIAEDLVPAPRKELFTEVEKAIRLRRDLSAILRNFVNMADLYDPKRSPIFRVGSLYVDSRVCSLCFEVADLGAFSSMATGSKCFLAYCELKRPGEGATRTICAVVTAGFAQTLYVGRNGLFYDIDGKDWEATIVKVEEAEISIKEAFWAPWRKIAGMISAQVNKILASKQEAALAKSAANVDAAANAAEAGQAPVPKKMDGAALASSVAAIGIAVGLLGSAVGGLVSLIAGIPLWKTLAGVLGIILVVSLPSMLIAWIKLRGRDLAPILNAAGWAVNRKMGFSLKLGRLWTVEAKLPPKAKVAVSDPFADKHPVRNTIIAIVAVAVVAGGIFLLWRNDKLNNYLPIRMQHQPAALNMGAR